MGDRRPLRVAQALRAADGEPDEGAGSLEEGKTVRGYRTLNVLGVGRGGRRGVLYHRLFSSRERGFRTESAQAQEALRSVGEALADKQGRVTYIVDSGFDDVALWASVWE
ncbi:MAG: hypothetical protein ACYC4L_01720 [Chloroflexota bacterium]